MAQGNTLSVAGLELEYVLSKVDTLFAQESTLLTLLDAKTPEQEVSMRNMRIPLFIQGGIPVQQTNYDGGSLGLGGSDQTVDAVLSPVVFSAGVNLTTQSMASTRSDKVAVENIVVEAFKSAKKWLRAGVESQVNSDGSGTAGFVTSVSGTQLNVNNPQNFNEGSVYQVLHTANSAIIGSFSVTGTSPEYGLTVNAIPGGTSIGDALIIAGGTGAAGSGLFGLEYHITDTAAGSWMGLSRSQYPYKLISPHVAADNDALSVGTARLIRQQMKQTLGLDNSKAKSLIAHCNLDQSTAWENTQLAVTYQIQSQVSGSTSLDMLKEEVPSAIGGVKLIESNHAVPGRIDFLNLENWGKAVLVPESLYDVNGQTQFQAYGGDGSVLTAMLFYYVTGFQLWCNNPRAQGFIDGLAVPEGFNLSAAY